MAQLVRLLAETFKQISDGVIMHAPLPAHPVDWAIERANEMAAEAAEFRAKMEALRPLVSPEATAEIEAALQQLGGKCDGN